MQPLDALTLHFYAGELDLKLADGKINKIQQPSHHELLFQIWVGGDASRQKLYINIRPEYAFCVLAEDTSFLKFPEQAPNFCMVLRKHLTSARIRQISSLPDDRVLKIAFENYNELGQQVHLVLSVELMGKNSNIILYDQDLNMILGCAHGVSEAMSSLREISVGYPYHPPPRQPFPSIRALSLNQWLQLMTQAKDNTLPPEDLIVQAYKGIGKATLKDIFQSYPQPEESFLALENLIHGIHLYPAVHQGNTQYSLLPIHQSKEAWEGCGSLNEMIQRYYLNHLIEGRLKGLKHQFNQVLKAQHKKLTKRLEELEKSDDKTIQDLKKKGDLLVFASSQALKPLQSLIEVEDYETGRPLSIEIDPNLTLSENAQLYYRRYKKAQARQAMANQSREEIQNLLAYIETLKSGFQQAQTEEELMALREDMVFQGWIAPIQTKKGGRNKGSQPLSVISSDGFQILVGKNNLQNDQISGKLSRTDDIWLHAHQIPGSHVLIRSEKKSIPDSTLLEAALLAAYYSQARHSVNVPVVFTKAQYVRKIPNSYPGHVNYTHESAINVTPVKSPIEALLGQASQF